jgi:hypothetical protein
MSKEREALMRLHELVKSKRENPPTTYSPLQPPNSNTDNNKSRGIDYGRLSGLLGSDEASNGKTS